MQKSYYFQHDYTAASDTKILFLRQQLGMEGYGIYWFIIEQLAVSGGTLPLKIIPVLSMQMQTTETKVRGVVEQFELFEIDENQFFSRRLNIHLGIRQSLSEAGKRGVEKREALREALREASCDPSSKERKGKETKGNEKKEIKEKNNTLFVDEKSTDKRWKFWTESWFLFYENKLGVKPSLSGAEAKALKTIRKYLSQMPGENEPDENGLQAWQQILDTWQCQDAWLITQLDLKVISSKINVILANIKKHTDAKSFRPAEINDRSNRAAEFDKLFAARYPSGGSAAGKNDSQ